MSACPGVNFKLIRICSFSNDFNAWLISNVVVVVVCLLWHYSAAYKLVVQSSLVLLLLLQNSCNTCAYAYDQL